MAEVLITLAIIGVVAALTIPVVVAKYQKHQYYTQFMKVYNTLSNAIDLSKVDNGAVNTWSSAECSDGDCADFGDKYLAPFLKVTKTCDGTNYTECIGGDVYEIGGGNGSDEDYPDERTTDEWLDDVSRAYLLQDSSGIVISEVGDEYTIIYVDTNGSKEPNIIGRDVFLFKLTNEKFGPAFDYEVDGEIYNSNTSYAETTQANCDPSNLDADGWGCADRLLKEGKMNY